MTNRTWVNNGGIALSAANLNSLEVDVQKGLDAFTAVGAITVNSWQPNTAYALNRYLLDPSGLVVKVTTAHTSTATYDASKFTGAAAAVGDATVAGYINNSGSSTSAAINAAIAGTTRINHAVNPSFRASIAGLGRAIGGATSSLTWNSGSGADGTPGFARLAYTAAATSNTSGINASGTPIFAPIPAGYTVGDVFTVSAWVRSSKATTVSLGGYYRNNTTAVGATYSGNHALLANTWTRISRTFGGIPAGVDNLYFFSYSATGGPFWQAGDTYDIDNVLVEKTSTMNPYFDGGTVADPATINEWKGIPYNSSSTQRVLLPALKGLTSRTGNRPIGQNEQYCNVMDFGAKRDNVTDDLDAFHAAQAEAIRLGHNNVYAPGGLGPYRTRSAFLQKSYVRFFGDGYDITTIKLLDSAPLDTFVVTNADWAAGNTYLRTEHMTLDWNVARTGNPTYSGEGGAKSSCITYANVQQGWIRGVKSINAGLHGIDITHGSLAYNYPGDMAFDNTPLPSRYIYIDDCIQTAWGDDGVTTHHSEYIFITNNFAYAPRTRGNNNGIEVDDGSRHVFIKNGMSMHCYGGLEIKAHDNSPAGQDVHVDGYVSIGDVRSYNWRHIGHHDATTDTPSLSARDITATNLVSISPNNSRGFQEEASPRALCISAFINVSVTNFTAIGNHPLEGVVYEYAGENVIAVQFMASNVTMDGINIRGFKNAANDVYFSGGQGPVSNCSITNLNVYKSAKRAIGAGAGVTGIGIGTVHAVAPTDGTAEMGMGLTNSLGFKFSNDMWFSGYTNPVTSDGLTYTTVEAFVGKAVKALAGTTILATCPLPDTTYHIPDPQWGTMTDKPTGSFGAPAIYEVRNGKVATTTSGHFKQELTRISTSATIDSYFRIVIVGGAAGPWYKIGLTAV